MNAPLTVIVSGCHSGPNPSPGLGIAMSLRQAFPSVRLVARDFSPAATGIHSAVFNEAWVCPAWDEMDLGVAWQQLERRLEHAWMIPGLDLEVRWLAGFDHPRILAPPGAAPAQVAKPAIEAAARLPVRVPDWIPLDAGAREVEQFCRRHGWQVWVKGPAYESRAVTNWKDLRRVAGELGSTWGGEGLFVQSHVAGEEVSLAFAAFQGELLEAVFLEKRGTTAEGKAWGGIVGAVPAPLGEPLRATLQDLQWTGGGELEFIRDRCGDLWLIDWNPRFPAWIHGATLAGHNLPAALMARATGLSARPAERQAQGFVRVVIEIPQRAPLAPGSAVRPFDGRSGKHPSGMPQLSRRLGRRSIEMSTPAVPSLPEDLKRDLIEAAAAVGATPQRVLLRRTAASRFASAAALAGRQPMLEVAYSVKTNPDSAVMSLARQHRLMAEVIGAAELDWALRCGWPADQIVYNGPVPLAAPIASDGKLRAVFADDAETFAHYLDNAPADVVGVRLRPPFSSSRFGVPVDGPDDFAALVSLFRDALPHQKLGVSFHLASSEVGLRHWEQLAESVLDFASTLEALSERSFSLVDFGGGWTAEDFDAGLGVVLSRLMEAAVVRFAGTPRFLIEPGKALVEPAQAVLTRVVCLRGGPEGSRSAVLDAGIADVPLARAFPHRLAMIGSDVTPLGPGRDDLLGPSCMEADCLAEGVALPPGIAVGDLLAICEAGAYDASMAYTFGRGGRA